MKKKRSNTHLIIRRIHRAMVILTGRLIARSGVYLFLHPEILQLLTKLFLFLFG